MIEYADHHRIETPHRSEAARLLRAVLAGVGWFFAGIVLLGVIAIIVQPVPGFVWIVVLVTLLMMTALANHLATVRRQEAAAVLGYLETAVLLRLPIPPYLRISAHAERGGVRRRLDRLAVRLERGESIGLAVGELLGELPASTIDRIRAAEGAATLERALPELVHREQRGALVMADVKQTLAYLCVVYVVMQAIVTMMVVFVLPKYAEMFRDYGKDFPPAMRMLAEMPFGLLTLLNLLVIPLLMLLVMRTTRALFISRPSGVAPTHMFDGLLWWMPIVGGVVRGGASADASAVMAQSLEAGRPLPEAIQSACSIGINRVLFERLAEMRGRIIAGEELGSAARASRLPSLMAAAFAMGGGTADIAGALAFAARAYASRTQRLLAAIRAVLPVVVTLILGVGVAFVALALIEPMVALIDSFNLQANQ